MVGEMGFEKTSWRLHASHPPHTKNTHRLLSVRQADGMAGVAIWSMTDEIDAASILLNGVETGGEERRHIQML